jgi:hypothetical protein
VYDLVEDRKNRIFLADIAYILGAPLSIVSVRTLKEKGII